MEAHERRHGHYSEGKLGGLSQCRQAAENREVVKYGWRKGGDNMNVTIADHFYGLQFCLKDCEEGGCLDGVLTVQYATESSNIVGEQGDLRILSTLTWS
ncbi:hypothetical protein OH77DRAFT_1431461, partial [Trametes cingulata]